MGKGRINAKLTAKGFPAIVVNDETYFEKLAFSRFNDMRQ
jgi:hypothetical protein